MSDDSDDDLIDLTEDTPPSTPTPVRRTNSKRKANNSVSVPIIIDTIDVLNIIYKILLPTSSQNTLSLF